MKTPKACLTRTIQAPGFGSAVSPAPAIGHGIAMPTPSRNGSASAATVPCAYRSLENSDDLNDDRRDARAGEQRGDRAHAERERERCRASRRRCRSSRRSARSRSSKTSNIASASTTKTTAIAEVEPGRRVDRAERAGRQDDDQAEHAVDQRHRGAVHAAEQEASRARPASGAGADDREVDRNHRQHARREVEREAAEEHEQQDRERPAAFEQSLLLDAGLRVSNERQEIVACDVAAGADARSEN